MGSTRHSAVTVQTKYFCSSAWLRINLDLASFFAGIPITPGKFEAAICHNMQYTTSTLVMPTMRAPWQATMPLHAARCETVGSKTALSIWTDALPCLSGTACANAMFFLSSAELYLGWFETHIWCFGMRLKRILGNF